MKISSWNVNSIRARIDNIKNYLKLVSPDLVLLQEIKAEEKNFPFEELNKLGYYSYISGQKSYNGVAFLSKVELNEVNRLLPGDKIKQARIISTKIKIRTKVIEFINIYVPNGNPVDTEKYDYKIKWIDLLIKDIKKKLSNNSNLIIGGDFNIIPEDIDAYDSKKYLNDALFRLEIRKKFRTLINMGLVDSYRYLKGNSEEYTFWDYMAGSWQKNHGLRIDHFLISNSILENVKKININKKPRSRVKPSDHTPIELEIN
jgi:exodeoxyribonuclease III